MQSIVGRYSFSHRLLDAQLGCLDALAVEIALLSVRDASTGGWKGIRLMLIRTTDVVYALGLRNREIVILANVRQVADAARNPKALLALYDAPESRLTIERAGKTQLLIYALVDSPVGEGSVAKFDSWGKIQKSGIRNSMSYRFPKPRKSNFATELSCS